MIAFRGKSPIVCIDFLPPTQDPELAVQKTSIVDILCTDGKGSTYIIKMQVAQEKGCVKIALVHAAKAYINQSHIGDKYQDLKEVIFLAIADCVS